MLKITNDWLLNMDKGLYTGVAYFDLKKVAYFDLVDTIEATKIWGK